MAHYYEDFVVGQTFETPARTITEADLIMFAGMTGDNSALHTDEEHASKSLYGRRLVHGMLVISLGMGLISRTLVFEGTGIAILGLEKVEFRKAVFIGDTLNARFTIESLRETSKPDRGIVVRKVDLYNQSGEIVATYAMTGLVLRRSAKQTTSP